MKEIGMSSTRMAIVGAFVLGGLAIFAAGAVTSCAIALILKLGLIVARR